MEQQQNNPFPKWPRCLGPKSKLNYLFWSQTHKSHLATFSFFNFVLYYPSPKAYAMFHYKEHPISCNVFNDYILRVYLIPTIIYIQNSYISCLYLKEYTIHIHIERHCSTEVEKGKKMEIIFVKKEYLDLVLVPFGLIIVLSYHLFLLYRILYFPYHTIIGFMNIDKSIWVDRIMQASTSLLQSFKIIA